MTEKHISSICFMFVLCIASIFTLFYSSSATAQSNIISGNDYVLPENSNYEYAQAKTVDSFFYGAQSLGTLYLNGTIENKPVSQDHVIYGATGPLSIQYVYTGTFQNKGEENWHIESDGTRWIRDYDVGFLNNIAKGCIMIEKSSDGKNWEKAIDPIRDYFAKEKRYSEAIIYHISESDYKNGTFFRVVIAYKIARRINDGFLSFDDYERRKCVEVYEFYIASERNYITIIDLKDRTILKDQSFSDSGFIISKNGSLDVVTVNGIQCQDYDCFSEPGEYKIIITTKSQKEYSYNITVTNGLDFTPLMQTTYKSEKNQGFPLTNPVAGIGNSHMTSLSLATSKDSMLKQDGSKFGITGDSVLLFLKLNQSIDSSMLGWRLSSTAWGKNKDQFVNNVQTGEVGTGALIIQTSRDNLKWDNISKARYENGIYTTDYAHHYNKDENVLIYTPSGQDVIQGTYIRILYAFQVKLNSKNEYRDYVEVYQFYLCSNELGAVTFHNLSNVNSLDQAFVDTDHNTLDIYKQAESLEDGGYTVSGFQIDKHLNPTVTCTVMLNGMITTNADDTYTESGKYNIKLTSAVGSSKEITIFVDRMSPEEAMRQYFGDGFLSGKRIFSEGEIPVYEGGKFNYHVADTSSSILPLYGQIINMTTGAKIEIDQISIEKTGTISEPGEYQSIFTTNKKTFTGELTGDARVFTFRFRVIPQGSAPGPIVNQKMLEDYSHSTVSDCNPVFYGLTYSSAGKGNITLAFATKEAAVEYAYHYEKGCVEPQSDGGYRYTGSFLVDQKVKYDSAWDLTDAVNYFAEAAVHKHYFDMSDEFTYFSLAPEVLCKYPNLRQLELTRSITIFADKQKEQLSNIGALPLLNDKPYAIIDPNTDMENRGYYSFEFVTDQYGGIDSKSVTITDSKGVSHKIRYSESVGKQLEADACPSGIVTVREETMYGDFAEYQAVYIAPEENQTELTLKYTLDNDSKTIIFKDSGNKTDIIADSFSITNVYDPLDPYTLLIVKHNQYEDIFTVSDKINSIWSEPGDYSITCINRLGYGYSINLIVRKNNNKNVEPIESEVTPELTSTPKPIYVGTITTQAVVQPIYPETQEVSTLVIETTEDSKSKSKIKNNHVANKQTLLAGAIIGLGLIAFLIVFTHRRIKLFARMADNMKNEENKKS